MTESIAILNASYELKLPRGRIILFPQVFAVMALIQSKRTVIESFLGTTVPETNRRKSRIPV